MKKVFTFAICILIILAFIATLHGGDYIGLNGILTHLSNIDFTFADTWSNMLGAFETIGNVGSLEGEVDFKILTVVRALFDLIRTPFIAFKELVEFLFYVIKFIFALLGFNVT